VPYDGAAPEYEDLYHPAHGDENFRYPKDPAESWKRAWSDRLTDLIDHYRPDLLYFDGGVPFGEVGRRLVAYYYNQNAKWHGGRLEAVLNIKFWPDGSHGEYREGMCVRDMERGVLPGIQEDPWQNDTSIGPWYYRPSPSYKTAAWVVHTLVDVVSRNGNLLLNVPLGPDGTLDDEATAILKETGAWLAVNGEAVYGTRPWRVFGGGPTPVTGGHFKERVVPFTAQDVRFTRKGEVVYAILLGWPGDGETVTLEELAAERAPERLGRVTLLGHDGELDWSRDAAGLHVKLPGEAPCGVAVSLRIAAE
jgi:alpha-L-fucosidase